MANSVEERLLLMDKEIVEFAFTIPPKFKIMNGCEKYILKKSVRDLLPKEIVERRKQPFGVPYTYWIKNELFELAEQKIEEGELINRIFDGDKCKRLMDGIKRIKDSQLKIGSWNHPYHQLSLAWNLFALELWYEEVFVS
jgi:asparagine synthase (glutamine-hydrolysing)